MAEPELALKKMLDNRKTMDDGYGRHALVHIDGVAYPGEDYHTDVNWLLPPGYAFHPTRWNDNYQPRHAVAECNTDNSTPNKKEVQ